MKKLTRFALLLSAAFISALPVQATVILDDTWADGERASTGPDGSGIDSAWYSSTGASLNTTPGSMSASIGSGSSLTFWTYFQPSGAPIALAIGETLQVTISLNFTNIGAQNTSRAFNFGLFDYTSGTRRVSDGSSPSGVNVTGYRQSMNFGTSFGVTNALQTQRRTTVTDANLLGTTSDYTTVGVNGGGNAVGATGFAAGTPYTFTLSLTRTAASSLDLTTTVTDGGAFNLTQTVTDSTAPTFSFDTLAFRPTTGGTTASSINFTQVKIDYTAVPEPSIAALAGVALLALARSSKKRIG
jgi:hypothetical protein